ncbi:aldehyde dehydrogenase family protein [Actinoplanes sp. CA-054009]
MQVTPRIGGRPATSAEWIEVLSPYDGEPVARVPSLGPDHVAAAVAAAAAALRRDDFGGHRRAEVLERAAALLTERVEEFAVTLSREAARPIRDARAETLHGAATLRHAAAETVHGAATLRHAAAETVHGAVALRHAAAETVHGAVALRHAAAETVHGAVALRHAAAETVHGAATSRHAAAGARSSSGDALPGDDFPLGFTLRRPAGVLAVISSSRFPLMAHVLAPAVAAGCPVVLKPADATPLSAIRLVELLAEAGLPPDWISVVTGPHAALPLAAHPVPAILSFTGTPTELSRLTEARPLTNAGSQRPAEAHAESRRSAEAHAESRRSAEAHAESRRSAEARAETRRPAEAHADTRRSAEARAETRRPAEAGTRRPAEAGTRRPAGDAGPGAAGRRLLVEFDAATPVIVARDADVERAIAALWGDISLFVDQELHDDLTGRLRAALAALRPGDPRDEATDAIPVVAVKPFAGLTEAIRLANEGGQAAIFTSDLGSAMRAARELRFARVLVNEVPRFPPPLGVRDLTDVKTVVVAA